MIYIDKQLDQEPESFRDWKTQHLLDNWLEKYTVGQWWDEMRKNTKVKKDQVKRIKFVTFYLL